MSQWTKHPVDVPFGFKMFSGHSVGGRSVHVLRSLLDIEVLGAF